MHVSHREDKDYSFKNKLSAFSDNRKTNDRILTQAGDRATNYAASVNVIRSNHSSDDDKNNEPPQEAPDDESNLRQQMNKSILSLGASSDN